MNQDQQLMGANGGNPINFQEPTTAQTISAPVSTSAPSPTPQTQGGIDTTVINLAKAIRDKESGGDYGAVGDVGTSTGAFQFQPDTWKQYAGDILGDQNAPMTKQNQNAVTYGKLKQFKDRGMNAAQSAAAWNAGEGRALDGSWTTHVGQTHINGTVVKYNTPQYVKDVMERYQQYKNGFVTNPSDQQTPSTSEQTPTDSGQNTATTNQSLGSELSGRMKTAGSSIADIGNQLSGKPGSQNWWSDLLHIGGSAAGAVGDLIDSGLNAATFGGLHKATDWVGGEVAKAADTDTGKAVVGAIKDFQQSHPEMAQDIGDVANIATLIPMFKGIGMVGKSVLGNTLKNVAVNGVKRTLEDATGKTVSRDVSELLLKNDLIDVAKRPAIGSSPAQNVIRLNVDNIKNVPASDVVKMQKLLDAIHGNDNSGIPYSPGKLDQLIQHKAGQVGATIGFGATGGVAGGAEGLFGGWLAKKAAKSISNKAVKVGVDAASKGRPGLLQAVKGGVYSGLGTIPSQANR
jgi:hypothetical protein